MDTTTRPRRTTAADRRRISGAVSSWLTSETLREAAHLLRAQIDDDCEVLRDEIARLERMADEYMDDATSNATPEEIEYYA